MSTLSSKYPGIVAYCNYMGSFTYWVQDQLDKAQAANAPEDTYQIYDGKISRLSELNPEGTTYKYFEIHNPELFERFVKQIA
jgi:hypothetical protein